MLKLENTPMSDIIDALASGRVTATALTKGYLARIEAYDRDGPTLNSVRELNPDALTIAGKLDGTKPSVKRPLAGVPILVKDNIATGDKQPTTAGSLALEGARAKERRHRRQAAARRRRGDPGQGEPDGVRQHPRDRHALGLLLAGRPGEEPLRADADGRSRHPGRAARAARARVRRSRSRPACARPRSAPRPRARCCTPPARTASSPSSRPSD